VLNAFDLPHRVARDVMRPRREMVVFSTDASLAECMNVAESTRYSRFPLCEAGDLDHTVGVVHIKDLYALRDKAQKGGDLQPACRKLLYIPETARLERLLQMFLERRLHLAIVVDEYGGTLGMVTLENILEELVGQIQDEFDQEKPLAVSRGDNVWEVDGAFPLHELSDLVGEPLRAEGIATTSGFVTQLLGGFPKPGERLVIGRCELVVEATDGLRVRRLRLGKRSQAAE
jgi:CBS domain containing-hemolysin-like protein